MGGLQKVVFLRIGVPRSLLSLHRQPPSFEVLFLSKLGLAAGEAGSCTVLNPMYKARACSHPKGCLASWLGFILIGVECNLASWRQKCTLKRTDCISLNKLTSCSECRQQPCHSLQTRGLPLSVLFVIYAVVDMTATGISLSLAGDRAVISILGDVAHSFLKHVNTDTS